MKNHIAIVSTDIAAALAFFARDESYTEILEREDRDVLFVCNVADPFADMTNFIFDTLLDTARAKGFSAVVAQAVPHQRNNGGGRHGRIRVLAAGHITFDEVMTVSSAHSQLARWWEGLHAFNGKLK